MPLFVMLGATLYFGTEVLVPVTLALLLAFILAPLVELLRRLHLGRVPSVLLGVVLALAVVLAIGGVIGTQVGDLASNIPQYAATIEQKVSTVQRYATGRLSQLADKVGPPAASAPPGASARQQPGQPSAVAPTQPTPAANSPASSPLELAYRYLSAQRDWEREHGPYRR